MTTTPSPAMAQFVEAWVPELLKSYEMFTGTPLVLRAPASAPPGAPDAETAWLAHTFERDASGTIWIGVPAAAVGVLMESASGQADERASLLRELLRESLRGAAHVLSTTGLAGLRSADADSVAPPPDGLDRHTVDAAVGDREAAFVVVLSDEIVPVLASAPARRSETESEPAPPSGTTFERFSGVDLPVAIILGRATMPIRDVLKLGVGSIIELDRHVSDPVEVCVNDAVIARGEVVSIRGNYGVRVLDVLTQRERMLMRSGLQRTTRPSDRPQVH